MKLLLVVLLSVKFLLLTVRCRGGGTAGAQPQQPEAERLAVPQPGEEGTREKLPIRHPQPPPVEGVVENAFAPGFGDTPRRARKDLQKAGLDQPGLVRVCLSGSSPAQRP